MIGGTLADGFAGRSLAGIVARSFWTPAAPGDATCARVVTRYFGNWNGSVLRTAVIHV